MITVFHADLVGGFALGELYKILALIPQKEPEQQQKLLVDYLNDNRIKMIEGTIYRNSFIDNPNEIFAMLLNSNEWDESMKSRKTMSFGKAYNYSQMSYPYMEMPPELQAICEKIDRFIGYEPNNCLINLYDDGKSKMGFHSDQVDILHRGTGITILSLGEARKLKFRSIKDPTLMVEYLLEHGSLFHMNQEIQKEWQHSIPKMKTDHSRISLTFRKLL